MINDSKTPNPGKALIGCGFAILKLLVVLPLWYYLLYQILTRVDATLAMWAAYWVYLPMGILTHLGRELCKTLFK